MLTGEYDYLTTPEESERAANANQERARSSTCRRIGHFPMSENDPVFRGYLIEALEILQDKTALVRS